MRQRARIDANQKDIVAALRAIGCDVLHLHQIGKGAPDVLVGYRGKCLLLELKDGSKPKAAQKLTPDEQRFHDSWRGQIAVVRSPEEAVKYVLENS